MPNNDVYPNFRFYVDLGDKHVAVFTEVGSLTLETKIEELEEGGNNYFIHKLPGHTSVSNVTLKRGITSNNEFFNWYLDIAQGKIVRRNISITMYDPLHNPVVTWNLQNAYPVKWIGPQFVASAATVAIETLELAHSGLTVDNDSHPGSKKK
jgi:phage tail-like protein